MRSLLSLCLGALLLVGCGPVEVRIDDKQGVPPIKGSQEVTLGTFTCGMPIPAGKFMVTTKVVAGGCEFSFGEEVPLLSAEDYKSISGFSTPLGTGGTSIVQRIELVVKKLAFVDGDTGMALDLNTRVTSATMSINGQEVADKAKLANVPFTVSLQGDALNAFKTKIDARQPVSVGVKVVAVIPTTPAPPAKLKVDYEAQPAVVLGPGKIF